MSKLKIKVHKIKGTCPIYKKGDTFYIIDGHKLQTDMLICVHSLSSIIPYYVALSRKISPKDLGLSNDDNAAYVQCLDPCEYTRGGTVIFKITIHSQ
ncbi:hypothetical protein AMJ52_05780 [candidate division TA06 bacterium DG_78]|uniref:TIGR04076 family protein n=1 Tax=candidate division TA06 bacterium DG_78 TaxID=1703772 RepID=A0A0S7YEM8_UNCT6|nr:MAG: hypothetical protein AMJ52_05780 [candidate division TA06 bacterium DG_78]